RCCSLLGFLIHNLQKGEEDTLSKGFAATGTLMKGLFDRLEQISSTVNQVATRVEELESTPAPRKSTLRAIEKGFAGNDQRSGSEGKELSLKADRQQIMSILSDKTGLEKGVYNEFYGNHLLNFEANGTLDGAIVREFAKEGYIITQ
ncbi:MAG: hypothetical protein JHC54_11275, partial [Acinetobacter sp.]|nr:hypothetical protein [Acinetobacter sp.]